MPKPITFSIVTPSYNHGQYLGQAIESVLSQAGDFFIEYTVADGASTDNAVEVIKHYDSLLKEKRFPVRCLGINFQWWSKPDNGQTQAMNSGLSQATGDLLADLDSDDYYEPGAFAAVAAAFAAHPDIDLFYGDGRIIYEDTHQVKITKAEPETFSHLLHHGNTIFQPSAFWTKRIADRIGLFDPAFQYVMDYEYWLRLLKNSRGLYLPQILATERLWNGTKTLSSREKFFVEHKIVNRKYGGPRLDPKVVYNFTSRSRLINFIRQSFPSFFRLSKKVFYFLSNRFHY